MQNQLNLNLVKMIFHIDLNHRTCALVFVLIILAISISETKGNYTETDVKLSNSDPTAFASFRKCCPKGQVIFSFNFLSQYLRKHFFHSV